MACHVDLVLFCAGSLAFLRLRCLRLPWALLPSDSLVRLASWLLLRSVVTAGPYWVAQSVRSPCLSQIRCTVFAVGPRPPRRCRPAPLIWSVRCSRLRLLFGSTRPIGVRLRGSRLGTRCPSGSSAFWLCFSLEMKKHQGLWSSGFSLWRYSRLFLLLRRVTSAIASSRCGGLAGVPATSGCGALWTCTSSSGRWCGAGWSSRSSWRRWRGGRRRPVWIWSSGRKGS